MIVKSFYYIVFVMFLSYRAASYTPIVLTDLNEYNYNGNQKSSADTYDHIFMKEAHERDDVYMNKYKTTKAYHRPEQCRSKLHDTYGAYTNHTQLMHEQARITYRVCKKLAEMKNVPYEKLYESLGDVYVPEKFCPYAQQTYKCDKNHLYRTYDGSCNNQRRPWIGKTETPMKRLQPSVYHDSMSEKRMKSVTGNDLPNPRYISYNLDQPLDRKIPLNTLTVFYSQFIDHDMSLTALIAGPDGKPKPCTCDSDDPDCINIPTPHNIPDDRDQKCMVTPRSLGVFTRMDCKLGPREQVNSLTHWLDLSQVYGLSKEENDKLRMFKDGLMKVSFIDGIKYEQLPLDAKGNRCKNKDGLPCFMGGEIRLNQNLALLGVHTLYLREHNRLARQLKSINPHLSENDLYELTRQINTAIYQHIVYHDWLPIIIGKRMADLYDMRPSTEYFYGYNPDTTPHIYNEFATAAFRFGHTLMYSFLGKYDTSMNMIANISLETSVLQTTEAYRQGGLDAVFRASLLEQATPFDAQITDALNNRLFVNPDKDAETHHFSLPALNVNRNRDHGLPSYTKYRKICGLKRAAGFNDLDNMPEQVRMKLAQIYAHVDDIELFIGGICENPLDDGVVGPTFASIIAKQFKELKYGDRHYYENGHDETIRYKLAQLTEIRKSSISRIICDNMDIDYLPKNPWFALSAKNPKISCKSIPAIDLSVFKV